MSFSYLAAMFFVLSASGTHLMQDETVVFCNDLQDKQANLLFEPTEIIRVEKADGTQVYDENIDYVVSADGTVSLPVGSRIPVLDYYSPVQDDTFYRFADTSGTWFYSPAGNIKHEAYDVCITYTYNDSQGMAAFYDGNTSSKITTAITMLENKEPLNLTFYGDSITVRWQASDETNSYAQVMTSSLKDLFEFDSINYANCAVGGKTTEWGVTNIQTVLDTDPDLVVLAFGMNDATVNLSASEYKNNTQSMMDQLRQQNPLVSIILVAEFTPNSEWGGANISRRTENRAALLELYDEYENVGFVDVGAVSRPIAARKKFQDFSGNNINHPNNFLHRIYAELILELFSGENESVV